MRTQHAARRRSGGRTAKTEVRGWDVRQSRPRVCLPRSRRGRVPARRARCAPGSSRSPVFVHGMPHVPSVKLADPARFWWFWNWSTVEEDCAKVGTAHNFPTNANIVAMDELEAGDVVTCLMRKEWLHLTSPLLAVGDLKVVGNLDENPRLVSKNPAIAGEVREPVLNALEVRKSVFIRLCKY